MKVTFTTGLMGSGKSKNLIEQFKKDPTFSTAFSSSLTNKTKTLGTITSRNGDYLPSINLNVEDHEGIIQFIQWLALSGVKETLYIDEIQFMNESTISEILEICIKNELNVHFFGLSTTFTGDYFNSAKYLIENIPSCNIIKIHMKCQNELCENSAEYNARIVEGKVIRTGDTFLENKSTYLSLCGDHYFSD